MVLNSVNFTLSVKLLISLSYLNESIAGYNVRGCRCFPFITLNTSSHSLLTCRISGEKSAVNHMRTLFYVICCFPLAAFDIFLCV